MSKLISIDKLDDGTYQVTDHITREAFIRPTKQSANGTKQGLLSKHRRNGVLPPLHVDEPPINEETNSTTNEE